LGIGDKAPGNFRSIGFYIYMHQYPLWLSYDISLISTLALRQHPCYLGPTFWVSISGNVSK